MYKIYIRTIALYGLENFRLSTSGLEKLATTETNIMKKMMGITNFCLNTDLMRALGIELTEEKYKIYKLDFVVRIRTNKFTNDLYDELESMNVKVGYPTEINEIIAPIGNVLHRNGVPFTTDEKAAILSTSLKSFGTEESKKSIQAGLIFQQNKKENIPKLLYFFLNSKSSDTFWPAEK
jgi:hypothetical protein